MTTTQTPPAKRLYSLMTTGPEGGWNRHQWLTTENDARKYAERYAMSGDLLTGPRGETLHRY